MINLTVNTIATLLIIYRAWYTPSSSNQVIITHSKSRAHHKSVQSIARSRRTQVEAILLLIIESGAVFAAIQVGEFLICLQKKIITVIFFQGLEHCHSRTGCKCNSVFTSEYLRSLCFIFLSNKLCKLIIPKFKGYHLTESYTFIVFCRLFIQLQF